MNVTVYPAARGEGKTSWILTQTDEDVADGKHVAIVLPTINHTKHAEYKVGGWVDVYSEASFERARGRIYDAIYVDDADLFRGEPVGLCARVAPGVPVALTYTPTPL